MTRPLKVFFPVESLAGLGHFNRAGLLVQAMVNAGMEVTVASGTFVDEGRFFPNAARIALPYYVHKNRDGKFTAWNEEGQKIVVRDHNNNQWRQQRVKALRDAVKLVRPDIIMFEFWPFSRRNLTNEVVAVLHQARALGLDPLKVCSVRDVIKGDVQALTESQRRDQVRGDSSILDKLGKHIDVIVIHGDERLIGLHKTFSRLGDIARYTHYSGYVVADLPPRAATPGQEVLVHAGSGSGGEDFFQAVAASWQHSAFQGLSWRFVTGPRFANRAYDQLIGHLTQFGPVRVGDSGYKARHKRPISSHGNFIVERYRADLTALMANTTLSVSLAGYNTTQELLALGTPALLVPKFRKTQTGNWVDAEQQYRLQQLQKFRFAHSLGPEDVLQPPKLAAAMEAVLAHTVTTKGKINFDGAATTARLLKQMHDLHQHKPKAHNQEAWLSTSTPS